VWVQVEVWWLGTDESSLLVLAEAVVGPAILQSSAGVGAGFGWKKSSLLEAVAGGAASLIPSNSTDLAVAWKRRGAPEGWKVSRWPRARAVSPAAKSASLMASKSGSSSI